MLKIIASFVFQDIHREIRKIARFLEVDLTEDEVEQIVENTSFSTMKKENSGSKDKPNPESEILFRKGDRACKGFCVPVYRVYMLSNMILDQVKLAIGKIT